MGYAPLYFEIPTPTYDPTKTLLPATADDRSDDGSSDRGLGLSVFGPSNTVYRITPHPLPPVRWTGPIVAQPGLDLCDQKYAGYSPGEVVDFGQNAPFNPPCVQPGNPSSASNPTPRPSTGAEATFVPIGLNEMLNLNTGEIVDGETANNIAQAATSNPSILTAPLSSIPPSLLSAGMKSKLQSGTVSTAQSTGIIPGGASWWQQTTNVFGITIPNWGVLAGAGGLLLLFSGGRKGRR